MSIEDVVADLEEAIDLIDKIESFVSRLSPNEKVSPGIIHQIYQNLVILREKIVEARMKLVGVK